ncbi:MAG: F-type H+-transporting ATPase subunit b [Acidimicrobiaceae bacterium]|jgi:F-type H+-transporting ATPase subunit b
MRMRKLLVATLLATGALVLMPSVASAQESPTATTVHITESNEECIKLLEEGKKPDDCHKAPSPILPATNELIWGMISFFAIFLLLWKFAWPGLKSGLEARTERIRADLEAAETSKGEADHILADYKAQLADARNESARIIEEARQAADALRRDQEQRLQNELAELRQRAAADIESAKRQAIADLKDDVAQLAIGAAEVIVSNSLDRDTQVRLVESYIEQVLNRSN